MRCGLQILLLLMVALPAHADQPAGIEGAADDFWKGRYSRAAKGYEAALDQHPSSADLWFNLGTAKAFAGQRGRAAHALEQALLFNPDHHTARYNLGRLRQQIIDDALTRGSEGQLVLPGDDDLGTGFLTAISPNSTAILFGLSWCALFLFLWLSRQKSKRSGGSIYIFLAVLMALVSMASGSLILGRTMTVDESSYGVVVEERAEARRGPANRYPLVARVAAGVKVELTAQDGVWQQVSLPNGAGVWLPNKSIRALQRP